MRGVDPCVLVSIDDGGVPSSITSRGVAIARGVSRVYASVSGCVTTDTARYRFTATAEQDDSEWNEPARHEFERAPTTMRRSLIDDSSRLTRAA